MRRLGMAVSFKIGLHCLDVHFGEVTLAQQLAHQGEQDGV